MVQKSNQTPTVSGPKPSLRNTHLLTGTLEYLRLLTCENGSPLCLSPIRRNLRKQIPNTEHKTTTPEGKAPKLTTHQQSEKKRYVAPPTRREGTSFAAWPAEGVALAQHVEEVRMLKVVGGALSREVRSL